MFNYKRLLGDSAIFAIGNLGSKLINFILVPLYTYYLTTAEYGTVDLVISLVNIFIPIISLNIFEAALRYGIDEKKENKLVFTNSFFITLIGGIIGIAIYLPVSHFMLFGNWLFYFYIIVCLQAFQNLFAQFTRSIRKLKIYAINGLLLVFTTGMTSIFLIAKLKLGIEGYFIATIIGLLISLIFLFFSVNLYKYIDFSFISLSSIKEMLQYSIPLIPNTISLWITNSSSRYFILLYLGASANGLFAVAFKIPALLTMINSVFFQAWQLSAIEEYESKNKSEIYSDVFQNFSTVMFLGVSSILVILKPLLQIVLSDEYFNSWIYVPLLLLGTVFSSFSSFLGTNYTAAKETKGIFKTTIYGAIINVCFCIVLIPLIGILGASFSYMASYFIVWILRIKDTKKYVEIKVNKRNMFLNLTIISFQMIFLYMTPNNAISLIVLFCLFLINIYLNKYLFKNIYSTIFVRK